MENKVVLKKMPYTNDSIHPQPPWGPKIENWTLEKYFKLMEQERAEKLCKKN